MMPETAKSTGTTVRLESARLYEKLGRVTAGGIVEGLEPIGAASVPELAATSAVDIGLAVWPFPLTQAHKDVVASLGYVPAPNASADEQRFFSEDKNVQLFFVMAGSATWTNYLLVRDFLRRDPKARQVFRDWQTRAEHGEAAKAAFFATLLKDAAVWWRAFYGFAPVEQMARELGAFGHMWLISSGWALDLFLGRVTRVHHDVDVVVARTAVQELRRYLVDRGWQLVLPLDGQLEPWPLESSLVPQIQVHAHRGGIFLDVLVTDMDAETWTYRRDPRVTCPTDNAWLQTQTGIPFLVPELILLFKSKNTSSTVRGQDESDFETVYPHLNAGQKRRLHQALVTADPEHRWLELL